MWRLLKDPPPRPYLMHGWRQSREQQQRPAPLGELIGCVEYSSKKNFCERRWLYEIDSTQAGVERNYTKGDYISVANDGSWCVQSWEVGPNKIDLLVDEIRQHRARLADGEYTARIIE